MIKMDDKCFITSATFWLHDVKRGELYVASFIHEYRYFFYTSVIKKILEYKDIYATPVTAIYLWQHSEFRLTSWSS